MSEPKRILALNWRCIRHPQNGGAELNLFEQARYWVSQGHEVTLICADPGRKYSASRQEVIDGIKIKRIGNRFTVYLWGALYLMGCAYKYDYILDVANGIPFFAPLFTSKPVVLLIHHVHGQQWFSEFPRPFATIGWFLERKVVPLIYRNYPVIAVSLTTHEALLELGFKEEQLEIVYNGVKQPTHVENSGKPAAESSTVVYVGRIKRYKRLDLLINAIDTLRHQIPNIKLVVAGDGDDRVEIENLVKELGLEDRITILGFVDEATKDEIMRSATVFVTPSMHEGWGLSVIEANTYGCPAVAYDVPGLRVAIRNQETGLLAVDSEAFTQAIALILSNPAVRRRLSEGALKWASRFSWEACAIETYSIMQNHLMTSRPKVEREPGRLLNEG